MIYERYLRSSFGNWVRSINLPDYHGKTDDIADEGLAKNATTMSQIPTYVTAVPNGTEEVCIFPTFN
jgi:hypothetical protein